MIVIATPNHLIQEGIGSFVQSNIDDLKIYNKLPRTQICPITKIRMIAAIRLLLSLYFRISPEILKAFA